VARNTRHARGGDQPLVAELSPVKEERYPVDPDDRRVHQVASARPSGRRGDLPCVLCAQHDHVDVCEGSLEPVAASGIADEMFHIAAAPTASAAENAHVCTRG
jgi:hypothetical protein